MKIYVFCLMAFFCSCSGSSDAGYDEEIVSVVDSFALNYFNLDIPSSVKFCTPESGKWLRFHASNVSEKDFAVLRQCPEPASYKIEDVDMLCDTSAVVTCSVSGFLETNGIEEAGTMTDNGLFRIPVVKRQGRWLVKMEGLLRNEKQSRD